MPDAPRFPVYAHPVPLAPGQIMVRSDADTGGRLQVVDHLGYAVAAMGVVVEGGTVTLCEVATDPAQPDSRTGLLVTDERGMFPTVYASAFAPPDLLIYAPGGVEVGRFQLTPTALIGHPEVSLGDRARH